jgi:hypothetical protein
MTTQIWLAKMGFVEFNKENEMDKTDERGMRYLGRHDLVGSVGKPPAHYAGGIEPIKFIQSHGMTYAEGCVVKYLCRYKLKGDPKTDLLKARAYIDMLLSDWGDGES